MNDSATQVRMTLAQNNMCVWIFWWINLFWDKMHFQLVGHPMYNGKYLPRHVSVIVALFFTWMIRRNRNALLNVQKRWKQIVTYFFPVNEQKCSTVNEQKCSTTTEQQCSTVNEQKCSTVNRQQCSTVQDRQCSTSYENECRWIC